MALGARGVVACGTSGDNFTVGVYMHLYAIPGAACLGDFVKLLRNAQRRTD